MLNVLTGFGVVVLIIGLGYAIGRKQLLGPKALYPLNMYVFWIALPATLLRFMSHADLGQIFGPNLAVVAISSLLTGFTSFALFYWIARRTAKESLIGMLAASYCNGSNLGIRGHLPAGRPDADAAGGPLPGGSLRPPRYCCWISPRSAARARSRTRRVPGWPRRWPRRCSVPC